jgi:hypothetical protein
MPHLAGLPQPGFSISPAFFSIAGAVNKKPPGQKAVPVVASH